MSDFSALIGASGATWSAAQASIEKLKGVSKDNMQEYSTALLTAQLDMSIAASTEQKTSSAIDKAYQAHSQVASK